MAAKNAILIIEFAIEKEQNGVELGKAIVDASRARTGVARAAFFPNISLTGSAGYISSDLSDLIGEDGFTWSWGPSLDLPVFNWGRRKASLNVARALELAAVASYEKAIQTAFREVSDALAGRRWYAEQVAG